ncbi:MAG: nickel insertion protein [Candidatus Micrarchaeota archaeon]
MEKDKVLIMEANIDDLNPQIYDYLLELLLENGALDAWLESIIMKKSRPAIKLSVICEEKNQDKLAKMIFAETTTIGIRMCEAERLKLNRKIVKVKTKFGEISVKVSESDGIRTIAPEYGECKKAALARKIPLKDVIDEARLKAKEIL